MTVNNRSIPNYDAGESARAGVEFRRKPQSSLYNQQDFARPKMQNKIRFLGGELITSPQSHL